MGVQALATKRNLASRIPEVDMRCDICGAVEESDVHVLFLCPFAREVWDESDFEADLWWGGGPSALAVLEKAATILTVDRLAGFVAIMWECWNSRNRFIFDEKDSRREGLAQRAIRFAHNFRAIRRRVRPAGRQELNNSGYHRMKDL